ncbi:MAG: site-2 protease family protein, partial [Jatrophihabitans sp.]|uniref:site-2 protease family protein n=1 Tax=Jatrophihabitans sp. TaxID=1932789 RepID=UPI003F7F7277
MTAPGRPAPSGRPDAARDGIILGTFFGVPVLIAPSWLIIAVLFTVLYGPALEDAVPGLRPAAAYGAAAGFSVLLALCVLAHELGHTAVSLALGHPVRRVVIFLMGGVSEVDTQFARPRDELLVAAAGPLVSAVITLGTGLGHAATDGATVVGAILTMLFWSNAALTVFNLLPGLPLDGGRLLRAALQGVGLSGRGST